MKINKEYLLCRSYGRPKVLRQGQWIFNEMLIMYPEEVSEIINTDFDCFYNDKKIDKFLNRVETLVSKRKTVPIFKHSKVFYRLGESSEKRMKRIRQTLIF